MGDSNGGNGGNASNGKNPIDGISSNNENNNKSCSNVQNSNVGNDSSNRVNNDSSNININSTKTTNDTNNNVNNNAADALINNPDGVTTNRESNKRCIDEVSEDNTSRLRHEELQKIKNEIAERLRMVEELEKMDALTKKRKIEEM